MSTFGRDARANYAIEASTNLLDWGVDFTTSAVATRFHWTETGLSNANMFYRALVNP